MRDNNRGEKTMRRNILFLLILLILAACSSPPATQIFATETKPAATTSVPTQKPTETPTPTEKPVEKNFIINSNFPSSEQIRDKKNREFPGYSTVTLEDVTSGRLATAAKKWYAEHPEFMSEAVTPKEMVNRPCHAKWAPDTTGKNIEASITEQILYPEPKNKVTYYKHPERIPLKVISFFPVQNDKILLETLSSEWQERKWLWIGLWAYKNPSGNVSSQSLFKLDFYDQRIANRPDNTNKLVEFMPVPVYAYTERNQGSDFNYENKYKSFAPFILDSIWKNHPELSAEPFAKKFGETGEMPEEMATKLFGVSQSCYAAW
jgi:hypothetical protein